MKLKKKQNKIQHQGEGACYLVTHTHAPILKVTVLIGDIQ